MVMTTDQRIALLARAREAKKLKKEQADALKPIPIKGRPKKEVDVKTLNLVEEIIDADVKSPKSAQKKSSQIESDIKDVIENSGADVEDEIIEEVIVKKIKKPKKRIIRKIIKEQYDSDTTEEEYEEFVYQAPKQRNTKSRQAIVKDVEIPLPQTPPREPEIKKPTFNLFSY